MYDLLSIDPLAGVFAALLAIILRARANKRRLSVIAVLFIAILASIAIPTSFAFLAEAWQRFGAFTAVTRGQVYLGGWAVLLILGATHRPGGLPRLPTWAGILAGVGVAFVLPPVLERVTGSYPRISLRPDANQCTRGMRGEVQPREVVNVCDEPITVGLCLSGEVNPTPCQQSFTIQPDESAQLDPHGESLSSLPSNPDGLTIVACRPPDRPSRMLTTIGRGYEGVCLPPS